MAAAKNEEEREALSIDGTIAALCFYKAGSTMSEADSPAISTAVIFIAAFKRVTSLGEIYMHYHCQLQMRCSPCSRNAGGTRVSSVNLALPPFPLCF